ncbi:Acetyltransferase (GNAT) domain-containing protein [Desulfonatronum thiosulfatophilum]|uniref:Acetyltransferase (GNAT) domain-containing protein n=1 Tax=Desulfonatronum thiosulfatophilum TaxID=617002 RepID=A0A1G6EUK6_9BACT|nr:GNAT family N-acetyltransferase [Desulfonatronum thiosulfatophilum]SDB60962.1 Acetyltransferase (GNAT) domain-containing protein [Desulfonatronum thiosulfatophilum]
MKTLDDIHRQEERIIARHPYLLDVDFRPVSQSGMTFSEIARFMDASWRDTYQGRERFIDDEPYLRWAFGWKGFDSEQSLLAFKNGRLVGGVLFTPRTVSFANKDIATGIASGLSVLPSEKGNGLGKMHFVKVQKASFAKLPLVFCWLHKSLNAAHSNYKIQTRADQDLTSYGDFAFKARVFDAARAVSNSDLLFHEKAVIRLLARPPRKKRASIEVVDAGNMEECLAFANSHARKHDGRVFAPEEFARYAAFEDGGFQSLGLISRAGGSIRTLVVGYPIVTEFKRRDRLFFLDYFASNGGNDLSSMEGIIRERFDVHTILSLYPAHGIKNLFLPTRNVLALKAVEFRQSLRPCRPMIVDHK